MKLHRDNTGRAGEDKLGNGRRERGFGNKGDKRLEETALASGKLKIWSQRWIELHLN